MCKQTHILWLYERSGVYSHILMLTSTCIRICVYDTLYVHVQNETGDKPQFSNLLYSPFLFRWHLSMSLELIISLVWLQKIQPNILYPLLHWGYSLMLFFLTFPWLLGVWTHSSCLGSKHFTNWASSQPLGSYHCHEFSYNWVKSKYRNKNLNSIKNELYILLQ